MPLGPELPKIQQILDLAASFGMELSPEEAASFQTLMRGPIASYRRVEELAEFRPAVKYPRDPGYRPSPKENPYNAWYWRTNIQGAPTGPLAGVRVGVKDTICVAGVPMMNGTRLLSDFVPDIDATVVTRLLDAGATIVGKTNCDDTSCAGSAHTPALGPIRNPRKPSHSPAGSSSGSAVALVLGEIDMALGGDQAGSIRMPAAWCGVVGLKPTYGLVPCTGCMGIEMTIDHVGPMANTVEDVARLLSVIAGHDPLDPRQRGLVAPGQAVDYTAAIGKGVKGMRIALVKEGFGHRRWEDLGFPPSDEVVDRKVAAAAKALERLGATVTEVAVPAHLDGPHIWSAIYFEGATEGLLKGNTAGYGWQGYYNTRLIESYAKGFKSRPNDLGICLKMILLCGEYIKRYYPGRYYAKGQNLRGALRAAYDEVLASHDALVMPTIPFLATEIPPPDCSIQDFMYYAWNNVANTCQFNVTGHPAMNVPCGAEGDLPIGAMIVGRHFDEMTVLQVARAMEQSGDWRTR